MRLDAAMLFVSVRPQIGWAFAVDQVGIPTAGFNDGGDGRCNGIELC